MRTNTQRPNVSVDFIKPEFMIDGIAFWKILDTLGNGDVYEGVNKYRSIIGLEGDRNSVNPLSYVAAVYPLMVPAASYAKTVVAEGAFLSDVPEDELAEGLMKITITQCTSSLGGMCSMYMRAYWYDCGMPTIHVGHKLAASLILTNVPDAVLQAVHLPFPTFRLDLPDGMFPVEGPSGKSEYLRSVLVGKYCSTSSNNACCYVTYSNGDSNIWNIQKDLAGLLNVEWPSALNQERGPLDYELTSQDARTTVLLKRLIANVIIYMTEGGKTKTVGKGHNHWQGNRRNSPRPVCRIFQLTHPVVHDFRSVVTEYANGTGKRLSVQSIVIGHWKQQAHGPKMSLRKHIFVEPYWRGKDDAPIASRPHMVND